MSDRVHDWLDGELPFEALTREEQERARRLETVVGVAAGLREARSPGLSAAVMAALPPGPPARRRGWLERLGAVLAPVPVAVLRPAGALAAVALLIGFGLGHWTASAGEVPGTTDAAVTPTVFVRFDLRVPDARTVQLAGSFSEWEPRYELAPAGDDHWTVTVPLEPGVHDYVFLVDGERQVLDPAAPTIADGFGSYNNRIALLASAT